MALEPGPMQVVHNFFSTKEEVLDDIKKLYHQFIWSPLDYNFFCNFFRFSLISDRYYHLWREYQSTHYSTNILGGHRRPGGYYFIDWRWTCRSTNGIYYNRIIFCSYSFIYVFESTERTKGRINKFKEVD